MNEIFKEMIKTWLHEGMNSTKESTEDGSRCESPVSFEFSNKFVSNEE